MDTFNSRSYNSWAALSTVAQDNIVVNWFSLQNEYICTSIIDEWNIVDFTHFNYPKNNWRWLLGYFQRWKNINLSITVKWDSISDFQTRLDNLRKNIFKSEVNLDLKIDWVIRRIKVNCINAPKNLNHYNITFLQVDINFETLEPFFYELSNQTSTYLSKITSFDEYIVNEWTTVSEPRIYFNFKTWISWTTSVTLTIWDSTISIWETISDNDALVINWEEKTVKLNDIDIDYNWVFPILDINWNSLSFVINWTFEVDINVINKINYV